MNNLSAIYIVTILFIIALLLAAYELNNSVTKSNELVQNELAYMSLNQSYANLLIKYSAVANSSNASAALAKVYANLTTPVFSSTFSNYTVHMGATTTNATGLQTGYNSISFTEQYPGYLHISFVANRSNVTALVIQNGTSTSIFPYPTAFSGTRQPYYWIVQGYHQNSANMTIFLLPGKYSITMQNFGNESASATINAEYASFNVK